MGTSASDPKRLFTEDSNRPLAGIAAMMWSSSPPLSIYCVNRNASSTRVKAGEGCLRLG